MTSARGSGRAPSWTGSPRVSPTPRSRPSPPGTPPNGEGGPPRVPEARCRGRGLGRAPPRPDLRARGRPARRGRRRRFCWRQLRPRHSAGRPAHRGDAGRGQLDVHRLPVQQRGDRGPARAERAAVHVRARRRRRHRRGPRGPYERASLIAHYLKTKKPRSKLIVLDAKDTFSKQRLFQAAWAELYPGLLEWVPLSKGGNVISVDAATVTLVTDFGRHKAAVANVIPPQKAGRIAEAAGVADRSGWCPIDPVTFESKLQARIHVIGDAAIAGAIPKSAFAANSQAKTCAAAVARLLTGGAPSAPKLINTCYSLVAPDYGISVAGVYAPAGGQLAEVPGSGGVSPTDAPRATRAAEAVLAEAWFRTIAAEGFG